MNTLWGLNIFPFENCPSLQILISRQASVITAKMAAQFPLSGGSHWLSGSLFDMVKPQIELEAAKGKGDGNLCHEHEMRAGPIDKTCAHATHMLNGPWKIKRSESYKVNEGTVNYTWISGWETMRRPVTSSYFCHVVYTDTLLPTHTKDVKLYKKEKNNLSPEVGLGDMAYT